ncbi:MAG: hypothetical protein GY914_12440, partial [Prochlorococcus sp.]|nr:hypothetical protein [Prochlorococcus sp.]
MPQKELSGTPCRLPLPQLALSGAQWSPMVCCGLPVVSHFAGCPCHSRCSLAHRGLPWSPVVSLWSPTLPVALAAAGALWHTVVSHGLPVVSHLAGCPCRSWRSLAHRGLPWSPCGL